MPKRRKATDEITLVFPQQPYKWDSDFPSTITEEYWVMAGPEIKINHPQKFRTARNTGKWLVFAGISELDTTWQKIKNATKEGILGVGAKAATAKPNPNASSQNEKVICVYTYNSRDKNDVFRVEQTLRSIGIEQTLYYKTDSDTISGQYKNRGDKNISKYISKGTENFKKYSLETLNGVGFEKSKILNKKGIKTLDDLIAFDTSKKLVGAGVSSEYINKLKLLALAQIENKIFKLSPFQFPTSDILHFDIETDIYTAHEVRKVWSIAIHHKGKVKHFYAEKWKDEKKILADFIKYLKSCKDTALFSYSSFDVSVLKYALKRYKLDANYFLNLNHFDLCAVLKQNYVLPLDSYSVKAVGKFFGYKYKDEFMDGLKAAMEYMSSQRRGNKISKRLLNYIQDDVKVMHCIVTKIQARKDIREIFEHKDDNEIADKYSNLKTSKPIQANSEYLIAERDFKCPFCESKKFTKHGKARSKFRYLCKSCKKSFTSMFDKSAKKRITA